MSLTMEGGVIIVLLSIESETYHVLLTKERDTIIVRVDNYGKRDHYSAYANYRDH